VVQETSRFLPLVIVVLQREALSIDGEGALNRLKEVQDEQTLEKEATCSLNRLALTAQAYCSTLATTKLELGVREVLLVKVIRQINCIRSDK
jgi:hypothetical protein